jgi:signal transduction histidine kinase
METFEEEINKRKTVKSYLILVSAVFILFVLFELYFDFELPTWIAFALPFVFIIPLVLLLIGVSTRLAVNLNLLLIVLYIQLVITNNPRLYHVLVYWIGIIPIMIVPLMNNKNIRIWAIIFLLILIFNGLMIHNKLGPYTLELDPFKFLGAGVIYWMITFSTLSIFSFIQKKSNDKLRNHNAELNQLRLEIEKQNELLKSQHEEIKSINEELKASNEHLEERIQQRTNDLEIRNEQLKEYAFINSHILRAPVARIIGLISLFKISKYAELQKEEIVHLARAGQELDNVVGKINKALDEETSLHRKHLSDLN